MKLVYSLAAIVIVVAGSIAFGRGGGGGDHGDKGSYGGNHPTWCDIDPGCAGGSGWYVYQTQIAPQQYGSLPAAQHYAMNLPKQRVRIAQRKVRPHEIYVAAKPTPSLLGDIAQLFQ
jgi:hypothetical protein